MGEAACGGEGRAQQRAPLFTGALSLSSSDNYSDTGRYSVLGFSREAVFGMADLSEPS